MVYIRNQDRMVYQTVYNHMVTQLGILGWNSATPPFGAQSAITILEEAPDFKGGAIQPNTVAMSEGAQPDDEEGELGASYGGLWIIKHTFFIDIYGESTGVAKALSSDLRGVFTGRLPGTSRYIRMIDYSLNPPAPAVDHLLRFEDVEIDRPMGGTPSKLRWEVVKATCVHQYNATEGTTA